MSTSPGATPRADGLPPVRAQRTRPRLTLPVQRFPGGAANTPVNTPAMVSIPMTPAGGIPIGVTPIGVTSGPFGMLQVYPNKASEFMFKQFEGFKDFTMNTAKSGLSAGEKTAFWMYGKVRTWSRKWFTHIFLFLVVMAYSIIGRSGEGVMGILSFGVPHQNSVCLCLLRHPCYMPNPSHPPNIMWRAIQIIQQLTPVVCHVLPLGPSISLQHPQSVPSVLPDTKFHTHTKQQAK